ncbi:hypothetical protein HHK36_003132 [Tetracentron sinense]|uniref:Protein kinase domain-containing protein n=1 Tax=Tetracentron sinense TaxID=13715 RepID=A0A834ZNI7_TETSI|nr:hypothetical protein HHK36_003132 [Tetracentron sinense]
MQSAFYITSDSSRLQIPWKTHETHSIIQNPNFKKRKLTLKTPSLSYSLRASCEYEIEETGREKRLPTTERLPVTIRRSGRVSRYFWDGTYLQLVCFDGNASNSFAFDDGLSKFFQFCSSRVRNFFIPQQVHGNYMDYVKWKFLHRVFSSALQVLATQAMFRAIGVGYSRSLPSAAALNWVLKDGLGRLCRCIYTASLASAFDTNLKRVRFSTSILFSLSIGVELLTPAFPQHFLLLATVANIAKQISLACYLATSSAVHRSFAIVDNLGEVSAKAQIQTVCFDNLGLMLAALLNILCKNSQRLQAGLPFVVYPIFSAIDLFGIYQGLKHVHLQTLTKVGLVHFYFSTPHLLDLYVQDRLEFILDTWIQLGFVPSPAEVSKEEGLDFLWSKGEAWQSTMANQNWMRRYEESDAEVVYVDNAVIESQGLVLHLHGDLRRGKIFFFAYMKEQALQISSWVCFRSRWEHILEASDASDSVHREWFKLVEDSKSETERPLLSLFTSLIFMWPELDGTMFPAEINPTYIGKGGPKGNQHSVITVSEKVIVAVRAEKEISKTALAWALTHVVRPGDCITLLAVLSGEKKGRKLWSFPRLTGDCGSSHREISPDRICQISESCSQLVLQFHDKNEVSVRIKVVPAGAVADESKKAGANWVVLDKQLKQEEKHCMEELHCNIVVMKRSQPKVLRLNLGGSDELQTPFFSAPSSPELNFTRIKHSTPVSSPEDPRSSITRTNTEEVSVSSLDTVTSPFFVCEQNPLFEGLEKVKATPIHERVDSDDPVTAFDLEGEDLIPHPTNSTSSVTSNQDSVIWIPQNHIADEQTSITRNYKNTHNTKTPTSSTLLEKFVQFDRDTMVQRDYVFNSDVRDAVSLSRTSSTPPPLCSLCQHKGPVFGKPPRWYDYRELEEATDGFSEANFLAQGGFGSVHRGVLKDGQVVAVKLLKVAGSQGDAEFCREVSVLSCAQHRNVVMLLGFCIEASRRVLVYEYVCNGSLDFHLHGNLSFILCMYALYSNHGSRRTPLDWHSRLKIAIGAARGLRYLHEDCRVGCIAHRDMRPNNIFLTHDFEPLVGDFGLARWHSEWDIGAQTPSTGNLGYLAPEYAEGAQITEKSDVYAFGMVLVELITGRKTSDLTCCKGQQFPAEWCFPLVASEPSHIQAINLQLLDPCLALDQLHNFSHQLQAMARAASCCLRPDPESRPPMSKVLRILEGGDAVVPLGFDLKSVGSRSGHLHGLSSLPRIESRGRHSRRLSH